MLGICLGAQLLAHELGAPVGPHPAGYHEFGYYELFPTAAGRDEIPVGLHVTQSHYHEFGLPAGATLLARSALYPRQAFRYGRNAYGFQFHAEVTRDIFRRWQSEHGVHFTGKPGVAGKEQQDRDRRPMMPPSTPGSRAFSIGCSARPQPPRRSRRPPPNPAGPHRRSA